MNLKMRFALSVKPSPAAVDVARRAEAAGFDSLWLYDVPVVWMDPVPLLGTIAGLTEKLRVGLCVTNPVTRPPMVMALEAASLQALSRGRFDLGMGRGDGAVRWLGMKTASLADVRAAVETVRRVTAGDGVEHGAATVRLRWASEGVPPVWIGTYGPRGLRLAGEIADGVILQFADPWLVRWAVGLVREAASAAGRDPSAVRVMAAATWGREAADVRWFTRMIGGDMARLVAAQESAPPDLRRWSRTWLDAVAAAEGGRPLPTVVDPLCDAVAERLCLLGDATGRLEALSDEGVEAFNLFVLDEPGVFDEFVRRFF